jgi:Rps23 Pro-64 3,4-dihydroxylase Tpa1-like proline 4-hydroxylase
MTPKQILDSFSETLMQDERILGPQERALLTTLLKHAQAVRATNPETQEAVRAVIASAVGETVAQRAFAVLGGSIVDHILGGSPFAQTDVPEVYDAKKAPGKTPLRTPSVPSSPTSPGQPQGPGVVYPPTTPGQPQGPGVKEPISQPHRRGPQPPSEPMRDTPASPGQPQGPGASADFIVDARKTVALLERQQHLPARCVVLDEFLTPEEVEELTLFTLRHEADFSASEVVSPVADGGVVNYEHRRSRVLMDLGHYQNLMLERIKAVLPQALPKLGMEGFDVTGVEAQITASNDGDFFHFHSDNGSDRVAARHLTFVYFFHREPQAFEGGELRIHDARLEGDDYVSEGSFQEIVPRQNQIIFFPCELMHEVTAVKCSSQLFADSRFTLNGWLRR